MPLIDGHYRRRDLQEIARTEFAKAAQRSALGHTWAAEQHQANGEEGRAPHHRPSVRPPEGRRAVIEELLALVDEELRESQQTVDRIVPTPAQR